MWLPSRSSTTLSQKLFLTSQTTTPVVLPAATAHINNTNISNSNTTKSTNWLIRWQLQPRPFKTVTNTTSSIPPCNNNNNSNTGFTRGIRPTTSNNAFTTTARSRPGAATAHPASAWQWRTSRARSTPQTTGHIRLRWRHRVHRFSTILLLSIRCGTDVQTTAELISRRQWRLHHLVTNYVWLLLNSCWVPF